LQLLGRVLRLLTAPSPSPRLRAFPPHQFDFHSAVQRLRRLLGFHTRMEVDIFLKHHGVELEYSLEDLERDRETHLHLGS
jgi:hypothetical protein